MSDSTITFEKLVHTYINGIKKSEVHKNLEVTGRTPLENFLNNFKENHNLKDIQVTHEPKRQQAKAQNIEGAKTRGSTPDFIIKKHSSHLGCVETKKVGEDLDITKDSEQIDRYKSISENIIISDYLNFIWIYEGQVQSSVSLCQKADLDLNKEIVIPKEKEEALFKMLFSFFNQKISPITKAHDLAQKLALPTRYLKEEILLTLEESEENSPIQSLYNAFGEYFYTQLPKTEFADAFAQTFSYSLFLTKIKLKDSHLLLTTANIVEEIPQSFQLLEEVVAYISKVKKSSSSLNPFINSILSIINNIDIESIKKDLTFTEKHEKDPYLFFYEDFLKAYDSNIRKLAGVYYTPEPVVKSIVKNLDYIIQNIFKKPKGLADTNIKILDFACGTGTFLLETYKTILDPSRTQETKIDNIVKNHILKNIYGLELLIPAYTISHLKLSEYLKEVAEYNLDTIRIPLYLTNTLNIKDMQIKIKIEGFPYLTEEGIKAEEVKKDDSILVIMGNPPYKGNSQNKFPLMDHMLFPYFPNPSKKDFNKHTKAVQGEIRISEKEILFDKIIETNTKWINDDYVKFIRFSEYKIQQAGQGVMGIITNHSFIDNPTFRAMRWHLLQTFDQIYIIDLHGNAKKKEKSPDGSQDQNIFDIEQGVAISFFIKKEEIEKGVFYKDIYGIREKKLKEIEDISLSKKDFMILTPPPPPPVLSI